MAIVHFLGAALCFGLGTIYLWVQVSIYFSTFILPSQILVRNRPLYHIDIDIILVLRIHMSVCMLLLQMQRYKENVNITNAKMQRMCITNAKIDSGLESVDVSQGEAVSHILVH